jgi:PAS domain S-box-containing protein
MEIPKTLLDRISALEAENTQLKATAAIKAEEAKVLAYQESQTIFKTIFEESRLGNKIINSDLTILEANAALVSLLGFTTKEEIVGTRILEYAPEFRRKDWTILQEKLWQHATPSFSLETCLLKRDGNIVWCQVTSILFQDRGETLGYTIIEDITEQHNLRLQKEQFISVASHELKTPITSLKAIAQLINKFLKADGITNERLLKLGKDADRQISRLIHLVNDLLSSTKLDQGQLSLNRTFFTLSDVIDGCCSHVQLENQYRLVFSGNHEVEVYADEHKIDQVIINLVNNAVKYAPASKDILVQVESIPGFTKVSVIDKGNGIPAESLPKLFTRYYRVEQNTFTPGLGLGLYISSEIIKRHGGEMGVESEIGKGTTFWFTLPDKKKEEMI